MKIDNISEFLSSCPRLNRGREIITEIYARANEFGAEKNITCKIPSNLLVYLSLTPEFSLNKSPDISPEYVAGTYRNITFIVSAYITDSIDILEN